MKLHMTLAQMQQDAYEVVLCTEPLDIFGNEVLKEIKRVRDIARASYGQSRTKISAATISRLDNALGAFLGYMLRAEAAATRLRKLAKEVAKQYELPSVKEAIGLSNGHKVPRDQAFSA